MTTKVVKSPSAFKVSTKDIVCRTSPTSAIRAVPFWPPSFWLPPPFWLEILPGSFLECPRGNNAKPQRAAAVKREFENLMVFCLSPQNTRKHSGRRRKSAPTLGNGVKLWRKTPWNDSPKLRENNWSTMINGC